MMQPETYEQIERYLLGKLSGPDLQTFEQRLASEPDLAKEVSLQREVFDAIRLEGKAAAFRRQLEGIEKKTAPEAPVRRIVPIRRWLALAAGLALLVVAGWWVSNNQSGDVPMTAQALFEANFNPPKSISAASILRDSDTTTVTDSQSEENKRWNALWNVLETKYSEQDFSEALVLLRQIQVLDPTGEYASETFYYAGLLHLQSGDAAQALDDFKKVAVGHTEDRDWYSALALLALDRKEEAKSALDKIILSKHPRYKQAAEILKKLD